MPLSRGPDGRLGVAAPAAAAACNVTFNVDDARRRQLPPLGGAGRRDARARRRARAAQSLRQWQSAESLSARRASPPEPCFHEIRFPTAISRGAQGGPERRTDVVVLGSGSEERNARWADCAAQLQRRLRRQVARRSARRHRLLRGAARAAATAFAGATTLDCKSCAPRRHAGALDQAIGTGDGHAGGVPAAPRPTARRIAPWTRDDHQAGRRHGARRRRRRRAERRARTSRSIRRPAS